MKIPLQILSPTCWELVVQDTEGLLLFFKFDQPHISMGDKEGYLHKVRDFSTILVLS